MKSFWSLFAFFISFNSISQDMTSVYTHNDFDLRGNVKSVDYLIFKTDKARSNLTKRMLRDTFSHYRITFDSLGHLSSQIDSSLMRLHYPKFKYHNKKDYKITHDSLGFDQVWIKERLDTSKNYEIRFINYTKTGNVAFDSAYFRSNIEFTGRVEGAYVNYFDYDNNDYLSYYYWETSFYFLLMDYDSYSYEVDSFNNWVMRKACKPSIRSRKEIKNPEIDHRCKSRFFVKRIITYY